MTRPRRSLVGVLVVLVGLVGWVVVLPQAAEAKPTYRITKVVTGLNVPWDLTWVGQVMLYDQRGGGIWSKSGSAKPKRVTMKLRSLYVHSEGGLLGLVADPDPARQGRFYTCQDVKVGGKPKDVRVLPWRLTSDTHAESAGPAVVTGLPVSNGRHSGCRLRFGPDGKLYVGTGDAAVTGNSQNRHSLGGKVLRMNADGTIPTDNPFYREGGNARYVWTYGHRNVQGLAVRPGTTELWNTEHGTYRDDELNREQRGGNYGWQAKPGYNESPPMTDLKKYPHAVSATWRSGNPTVATSGLAFLDSSAWGHWQGAAAMGMLKGQGIKIAFLDPRGKYVYQTNVTGLKSYGRIRTVQIGPDKALYFTTSNANGHDVIAKITPTATPPTLAPGQNIAHVGVSAVRTGSDIYAFIRSTGDTISYKRSSDDGRTWDKSWTSTGLTSTTAPAVASSAPGRVDVLTRNVSGAITHTWFVNRVRQGQTELGEAMTTATVSSAAPGTLDVFGLGADGGVYRRHFDGGWSGWRRLSGGGFTSAVGASVDHVSGSTVITARGRSGAIFERTVTPTADGADWTTTAGLLWSGRALGDRFAGHRLVAVSKGSDGFTRWQQGATVLALPVKISSDPDVVTRSDGSWLLFGRSSSGTLTYYDARPGGYQAHSLGGTVR